MNEVSVDSLQEFQASRRPDAARDGTNQSRIGAAGELPLADLQLGKWLAGAAVGALAMYMLDPQYGPARRAQSRQKLRELGRQTGNAVDKVVHEVGPGMELGGSVGSAQASRPRGAGSALASVVHEAGQALKGITERETGSAAAVAGAGASGDGRGSAPAGDGAMGQASGADIASTPWLPDMSRTRPASGMRSAAVAAGGLLGLFGLFGARSLVSTAAGLAGIALLARASSRQPLHTMLGAGTHARPVTIEKSLRIDAAPEQVYDQFANYANFPRFMSHVVQVRDLGHGRSHWIVKGPGGTEFAWTAALTEHDRPHRLAWRSEPGAELEQAGSITLEPDGNGTRVNVHIAYRPPAGAVGRTIARLMGGDPARELEEDLERMKMLIERATTMAAPSAGQSRASQALH